MRKVRKEAMLAAEAWVEIFACRARMKMPRLLATEAFLRSELGGEASDTPSDGSLEHLMTAFSRALRAQPGSPRCLPRSLALRRFLARHGHAGTVALGLRKVKGRIDGHAWVEAGGGIVSGDAPFVRSFRRLETGRKRSTVRRTDG